MRVLVCGGRSYGNRHFLFKVLDKINARQPISRIIEGGAAGADTFARNWAKSNSIPLSTYNANWDVYGNRAGMVRNAQMLREGNPDLVVAFEGGRGTANMVSIAMKANVKTLLTWKFEQ